MNRENSKVAIIGMACRTPGANQYSEFWELLRRGEVLTGPWPKSRRILSNVWSKLTDGTDATPENYETVMSGGYLKNIADFDNRLFGLSPKEARVIDPQQRMLMEESWLALHDAGIDPRGLVGADVGVIMGVCAPDYSLIGHEAGPQTGPYSVLGSAPCMASNRISYALDLNGPSITLDAACSASAHAIHQAVNHLILGDCSLAIAGGVNAILSPTVNAGFETAHMLSKSMRCKSFDKDADGYVRSEGAGVVILKLLDNAIADGDPIHAVIEASALNQDGRTKGIAMPSQQAQIDLFNRNLAKAGLSPNDISFVEAHGTGTPAGDPTEASALASVFEGNEQPCYMGTLKANIGHTEAASGVLALIKAVMTLKHRVMPRQVGCYAPLPIFEQEGMPLELPKAEVTLPKESEKEQVYAAISAFGFGGSNANIILSSYQHKNTNREYEKTEHLVISTHTLPSFDASLHQWFNYLDVVSEEDFALAKRFSARAFGSEKYAVAIPAASIDDAKKQLTTVIGLFAENSYDALSDYHTKNESRQIALDSHPHIQMPTYPFDRQELWAKHLQIPRESEGVLPDNITMDFGQSYINEHRIVDEIVVPGASMLMELMKSTNAEAPDHDCQLVNIDFKTAFIIRDKASAKASLKLSQESESSYRFELIQLTTSLSIAQGEIILNG